MTDNAQNPGQYSGGFTFGQNPTPPVPPSPPAPPAPVPMPPAQPAPAPAYPQPAPYAPDPMAGMASPAPYGSDPYAGMPTPPPQQDPNHDPNYVFASRMQNFTTTVKLPPHSLSVNEAYFLNLLAGSISLTKDEKKKIIDSMGKLRQAQVDELVRIFEEERSKFIELSPKHGAQLKKLEDEHRADWVDIEMSYKQEAQQEHDAAQADEIRKQLGL